MTKSNAAQSCAPTSQSLPKTIVVGKDDIEHLAELAEKARTADRDDPHSGGYTALAGMYQHLQSIFGEDSAAERLTKLRPDLKQDATDPGLNSPEVNQLDDDDDGIGGRRIESLRDMVTLMTHGKQTGCTLDLRPLNAKQREVLRSRQMETLDNALDALRAVGTVLVWTSMLEEPPSLEEFGTGFGEAIQLLAETAIIATSVEDSLSSLEAGGLFGPDSTIGREGGA